MAIYGFMHYLTRFSSQKCSNTGCVQHEHSDTSIYTLRYATTRPLPYHRQKVYTSNINKKLENVRYTLRIINKHPRKVRVLTHRWFTNKYEFTWSALLSRMVESREEFFGLHQHFNCCLALINCKSTVNGLFMKIYCHMRIEIIRILSSVACQRCEIPLGLLK